MSHDQRKIQTYCLGRKAIEIQARQFFFFFGHNSFPLSSTTFYRGKRAQSIAEVQYYISKEQVVFSSVLEMHLIEKGLSLILVASFAWK
jgi:hypothetical protein